jgi:hypothetical protein
MGFQRENELMACHRARQAITHLEAQSIHREWRNIDGRTEGELKLPGKEEIASRSTCHVN